MLVPNRSTGFEALPIIPNSVIDRERYDIGRIPPKSNTNQLCDDPTKCPLAQKCSHYPFRIPVRRFPREIQMYKQLTFKLSGYYLS